MTTHETVRTMTDGQKNDIIATMVGAIPSLTFDEAQSIIGGKGPFVADIRNVFERRHRKIPAAKFPHYHDSEVFELTLNPVIAPLDMVANDGYSNPKKWKFHGTAITEPRTGRFKWVEVGYCRNLGEAQEKLKPHGKIPEGQWREAVEQMFEPDGKHPRGIADPSWENPFGDASFPCVDSVGDSSFVWAGDGYGEGWRWLVRVSK